MAQAGKPAVIFSGLVGGIKEFFENVFLNGCLFEFIHSSFQAHGAGLMAVFAS